MSSKPDHTSAAIAAWDELVSENGRALLDLVDALEVPNPSDIQRFRSRWPVEVVTAALELVRARRRARTKFDRADRLWCDLAGVEQATDQAVADWKARRFAEHGVTSVLDLCCGIGADAMALSKVASVEAVDRDPLRCWMTARNAGCTTTVGDVTELALEGRFLHVDPARRDEASGRRSWNPDQHQPAWNQLARMLEVAQGAACKLGPGIPLPLDGAPDGTEYELIQSGGRLVQAVLWTGALASNPGVRRATLLPEGRSVCGAPGMVSVADELPEAGTWLVEARPALERAELIAHQLADRPDVLELAPGLGLLVAGTPVEDPWFIDWRIEAVLPLREKPLKRWLREHDAGEVVVRTRGGQVDVDAWSRSLRGSGSTRWIVFALRLGSTTRAIVTQSAD